MIHGLNKEKDTYKDENTENTGYDSVEVCIKVMLLSSIKTVSISLKKKYIIFQAFLLMGKTRM